MRTNWLLACLGLVYCSFSFAQTNLDALFEKTGFALWQDNDTSFLLTNNNRWESGSIWFKNKIDLTKDFEIDALLNFGVNTDLGADGIAFVLQPLNSSQGASGGGIGYQGINPSLAIEFDDFYNPGNDPVEDHISFMSNGSTAHSSTNNLFGPFLLHYDIEDGKWHKFYFKWESATQKITMRFDDAPILNRPLDIVSSIFKLDPFVFWGFTSATGDKYNTHKVRFKKFSFTTKDSDSTFFYSDSATSKSDSIPETIEKDIRIANVFTPNRDDKNDVFKAIIKGHDLFEIFIYNRWGAQVYYSKDASIGWNGQVENTGIIVPNGTYFYLLNYRFKGESKIKHLHGSVQLIREAK